jgi:malonyl-CoA O-methyltransferase
MQPTIDKRQARHHFGRAASSYDAAAVLQREVGLRLRERLDGVRLEPRRILDLGAGTGADIPELMRRFDQAQVIAIDLALPMAMRAARRRRFWRRARAICGDMEYLPLRSASVELAYSNLALQWSPDLALTLRECRRVLAPGGLLHFATLGPDTLKELRAAAAAAGSEARVSTFPDLHDVGDLLLREGFVDPVMSMEVITLTYRHIDGLFADLRGIGAQNALQQRGRGLGGRARLAKMRAAYEYFRREGRLPATYEVVYGHAWVPDRPQTTASGEVHIPVDRLRRSAPTRHS